MSTPKPYPSDVSDEEWAFVAPYLALLREDALEAAGFDPLRTVHRGDFIYVRGVKH
jgi:hypothetical protein